MDKPKILVVEDEKETLELMMGILNECFESEVEGVMRGGEALRLMEENNYDLVVLDIKLDELSGLDIIRQIKKQKSLPDILIVTAWDSRQVADGAIDAGAIDYMPKPVDADCLVAKVKMILEKKGKCIER